MTGIDLDSEQMVRGPAVEDDEPTDLEQATATAKNDDLQEITGVDPHISGVNPTEIKLTWTTCLSLQTMNAVTQTIISVKNITISVKEENQMVQISMLMPPTVEEINYHQQ